MGRRATWGLEPDAEVARGLRVVECLGGGKRFEVYRVWDEQRSALVVAKLLRPDRLESKSARRRMRREVEALERLAHPGLVRGLGAELDGPRPHLLVEHLEGPTLRSVIRRDGPLPLERALPVIVHLLAVADHIAAQDWVHLDIKPGNVIMGIPPRLIDLSLARPLEVAATSGPGIGTRVYMPPEQCCPGELGRISSASDVWGIGATAYEAVTGKLPFRRGIEEGALAERYPQVEADPRPLPPAVPPALAELLLACLRRDPEDRPTAAEVATALEPLAITCTDRAGASAAAPGTR